LREVLKHFAQKKDHHLPGSSYRQARRQTHRCLPRRTRSVPTMRPSHAHPRRTSQGQTLRQERKTILPQKPRLNSSATHKFCGTAVFPNRLTEPPRRRCRHPSFGKEGKKDFSPPLRGGVAPKGT